MKKNATMVFYNERVQLYLETDISGVDLQVRDGMHFPRNEATDNQCFSEKHSQAKA